MDEAMTACAYLALGAGVCFEGEASLLAAGALAQRGVLSLPLVVAVAAAGSGVWSISWFVTGRRLGVAVAAGRPRWAERARRFERWMVRRGTLFILGFRFVVGMGTVSPALLGASRYPIGRFLVLDSVGATVWATAVGMAGWATAAGISGARAWTGG